MSIFQPSCNWFHKYMIKYLHAPLDIEIAENLYIHLISCKECQETLAITTNDHIVGYNCRYCRSSWVRALGLWVESSWTLIPRKHSSNDFRQALARILSCDWFENNLVHKTENFHEDSSEFNKFLDIHSQICFECDAKMMAVIEEHFQCECEICFKEETATQRRLEAKMKKIIQEWINGPGPIPPKTQGFIISCRSFEEFLDEYMHGQFDPAAVIMMLNHAQLCEQCTLKMAIIKCRIEKMIVCN